MIGNGLKKKSKVKSVGPVKSGDHGCSPFSPWVNPALCGSVNLTLKIIVSFDPEDRELVG